MTRSPLRHRLLRSSALLGATMLVSSAAAFGAHAAQLPVVVQQAGDPMLAGLQIPANAPSQGMWSGVQPWPLNAISLVVMPNGKIASYGTPINNPSAQYGMVYDVWDPTQGYGGASHTQLSGVAGVNSFCSAQAFQPDGSLLISGGIFDSGTDKGSAVLNSSTSGISALGAKLADDRYYATMITKPDGNQLIMGGSYPYKGGAADPQGSIDQGFMTGMTPETYNPLTGWTSLFGATSRDAFGPDNQRWWYPRAWVAPNGRIFGISAEKMWYLDPNGAGSVTSSPFKSPQAPANVATAAPNVGPTSTAVMYDVGKILQVGGNSYDNFWGFLASSQATTVDINGGYPNVVDTRPMNFGRSWANSTVLPTGKVFVNGGSLFDNNADAQAVLAPETWDPANGSWTVGPAAALYRGYHSSAVLMQNGTVLVAGGGAPGPVNNQNVEVYYPPYLFANVNGQATLAARPQIVSLSTNRLLYGQSMQVEVASGTPVAKVVLIGLSQTTHSFNTGQRRYPMAFSQGGTIITAQTPPSGAIVPPGYYQLAVVSGDGVPSPGAIVAVGASTAGPGTTAVPTGAVAADLGGMAQCAVENATCTFNGTQKVLYGANGTFASKTATGSLACNSGTFGNDPVPGIVKACYAPAWSVTSAPNNTPAPAPAPAPTPAPGPAPAPVAASGPNGLVRCAAESETCSFNGTQKVLFGANGTFASRTATGSLACTNDAFGGDPVPGIVKACYSASAKISANAGGITNGMVQCAGEGATCNVNGTQQVLFGANGVFATRMVSGSTACTSDAFGYDPVPGIVKACFSATATVSTASASGGTVQCALENDTCSINGTGQIFFGANGTFASKTATGSISCTSGSFGYDPVPGTVKACYTNASVVGGSGGAGTLVQCAVENATCIVNGTQTVRFGANGIYATRTVTGAVICNAGPFGDPVPGVVKACYVSSNGR